jgi:hypothetical protein
MPIVPEPLPARPLNLTGFPNGDDLDQAEQLCRGHAPVASVGAYGNLIRAIAETLAAERRVAFNEGAVAGMKLIRSDQ